MFKKHQPTVREGEKETFSQQRLSSGDSAAFRLFFEHYHAVLYTYILKIVKSNEVAEELVMDIFLKIWSAREILNDVENVDAFLYRMAVNKALDFLKASAREKKLRQLLYESMKEETSAPVLSQETREYTQHLDRCLRQLPQQQQLVVTLSREEGLTHEQIAARLNLSRNTVKNHMVTAMKNLRQFIKNGYCLIFF